MQIIEEWAAVVYGGEERARRLGVPPDKKVAKSLSFVLDDFEKQKLASPLFEVYQQVSKALELPTQEISVYLPRLANQWHRFLSPSPLEFKAYQGVWERGIDSVPRIMVSYDRRLFENQVFFDSLDVPGKDNFTLEQITGIIKHNAYARQGERIIIDHNDTVIALKDKMDYPKFPENALDRLQIAPEKAKHSTKLLVVHCKIPWLAEHKIIPKVEMDLTSEDSTQAAEKVKNIFDSYMKRGRK